MIFPFSGRSPRARERAKDCPRLPSNQQTFPPIAQAMGAVKSFCPAFFKKREKSGKTRLHLCALSAKIENVCVFCIWQENMIYDQS